MTLSEFLLARIAEDVAVAVQIGESSQWTDRGGDVHAVAGMHWRRLVEIDEANGVSTITAEHIARHDPARVLDECEAKRKIMELHPVYEFPQKMTYGTILACSMCGDVDDSPNEWPCETLRALALPYSSHPDFQEEWR